MCLLAMHKYVSKGVHPYLIQINVVVQLKPTVQLFIKALLSCQSDACTLGGTNISRIYLFLLDSLFMKGIFVNAVQLFCLYIRTTIEECEQLWGEA